MYIVKFILTCIVLLLYSACGQVIPRSPCPTVFHYEWIDELQESDLLPLKGVLTITSTMPISLKIRMEIAAPLTKEYRGRLEVVESRYEKGKISPSKNFVRVKYNLHYPRNIPIPHLVLIEVNNKVICSSSSIRRPVKTTIIWNHSLRSNSNINYTEAYRKPDQQSASDLDSYHYDPTYQTQESTQSASSLLFMSKTCGKPIKALPLIIGGVPATWGDWPWMVPIYKKIDLEVQFICAGTLISNQFVVTAAHCLTSQSEILDKRNLIAFVGRFNLRNWAEDHTQPREISDIFIHPDYDTVTLSSDLVLLKLKTIVYISRYINPACIWEEEEDLNLIAGKKGLVFGWGMDESGLKNTDIPNLSLVPIATQEECLRSNPEFYFWTSNKTLCAGPRNGTGPCSGDSGGGLLLPRKDKEGVVRWYLRGVVSLSLVAENNTQIKCNLHEYVVFTDLAKYRNWILGIIT